MNWQRFSEWILFGVCVGAFPVLARFFAEFPQHPPWHAFLANGDLFLVSTVLSGAGIGRLLMTSVSGWRIKGIVGFVCVLAFGLATWQYVAFCSAGTPPDATTVWVAGTALVYYGVASLSTALVMGMP